jgi:hypothetical protein
MKKSIKSKNEGPFYDQYRRALNKLDLSRKEVDEMRSNLRMLAETICEHVWGKKFY